ncbi:MAG TPA: hypothetical protein DFS52_07645 [Myxococcales bacterium]|nr:hypothetical protein [Myxococcales bacterium]
MNSSTCGFPLIARNELWGAVVAFLIIETEPPMGFIAFCPCSLPATRQRRMPMASSPRRKTQPTMPRA